MTARAAFALAAVVAYFLALHALNHPKGWARAARALWDQLRHFCHHMVTEPGREPVTPAAIAAHPSVKAAMTGPVPADGKPLSGEEERILGRIEMDALIGISEPTDGSDR